MQCPLIAGTAAADITPGDCQPRCRHGAAGRNVATAGGRGRRQVG